MILRISSIILLYSISFGCNNTTATNTKKDSAQQSFFPVTQFILGQLKELDSLPVTPLKIIIIGVKSDSIWMQKKDIRPFAEPFLHPLIDTANLRDLFSEKSFLDQTINAFTFSYDPYNKLPDTLQLKRWDVYIDPQKNTIKRIYLLKEEMINGELQTLQLTWKTNQWCKITTILEHANRKAEIKEEVIKWNFTE